MPQKWDPSPRSLPAGFRAGNSAGRTSRLLSLETVRGLLNEGQGSRGLCPEPGRSGVSCVPLIPLRAGDRSRGVAKLDSGQFEYEKPMSPWGGDPPGALRQLLSFLRRSRPGAGQTVGAGPLLSSVCSTKSKLHFSPQPSPSRTRRVPGTVPSSTVLAPRALLFRPGITDAAAGAGAGSASGCTGGFQFVAFNRDVRAKTSKTKHKPKGRLKGGASILRLSPCASPFGVSPCILSLSCDFLFSC